MNLKEAYTILGISSTATPEEVKKQYRKLTKEFHPDINKEPGAEDKFKKINEAYQVAQSGKSSDLQDRRPFGGGFHRQQVIQLENIEVSVTISFKESVLGCKKDIKYSRQNKCQECNGSGEIRINNGCKKCGGRGQIVNHQGHMVMVTACNGCNGQVNMTECPNCKSVGTLYTDTSVQVSIPAGIINGNVLRLQNMGNYAGSFMGFADQHTDVFCHITVIPEPGLNINGKSVISYLVIPLLDAIKGCTKQVETIFGVKEIIIKSQSRNKDEIIIPHCGVGGTGDHKVILDVRYPKDIDKLINVLPNEEI